MAKGWDDEWEVASGLYSPEQVESVLEYAGVEIVSGTSSHYLCYCPFHGNSDTAAFAINKQTGMYCCFNPSCGKSGSLEYLVRVMAKVDKFEANNIILSQGDMSEIFFKKMDGKFSEPAYPSFPQATLDRMHKDMWDSPGYTYLKDVRDFEDATLEHFQYGYSQKQNMVTVPMHDPDGNPVGVIGRSIEGKSFKNSKDLPKSKTMYNFHRVKRYKELIVVEASFDTGLVHQAGFPNTAALLGGYVSQHHLGQMARYFDRLILMVDNDEMQYYPNCARCRDAGSYDCNGHRPGRDLGNSIIDGLPNMRIDWASYEEGTLLPHDAKDPGNLNPDEIAQCINNAVSNYEFSSWSLT